ncbi:hypothetical protein ABGB16_29440 [Micromonospora sp. B11E3]|uniref:hypothetical protein n=1 Tax=Micromonospora sp. B11E3 TaxID=3153562 RepID=UPI00325DAB43
MIRRHSGGSGAAGPNATTRTANRATVIAHALSTSLRYAQGPPARRRSPRASSRHADRRPPRTVRGQQA